MYIKPVQVATTIGDLAGLPIGTRIATNHNKLLVLTEYIRNHRTYWMEDGELTPYSPLVHWLPCIILPPVVDSALEEARDRIQEILGAEVIGEKNRLHNVDEAIELDDDEEPEEPEATE